MLGFVRKSRLEAVEAERDLLNDSLLSADRTVLRMSESVTRGIGEIGYLRQRERQINTRLTLAGLLTDPSTSYFVVAINDDGIFRAAEIVEPIDAIELTERVVLEMDELLTTLREPEKFRAVASALAEAMGVEVDFEEIERARVGMEEVRANAS